MKLSGRTLKPEVQKLLAAHLAEAFDHAMTLLQQCECGEVFLKNGRREFCSDVCQKRYYMRRYRSGRK